MIHLDEILRNTSRGIEKEMGKERQFVRSMLLSKFLLGHLDINLAGKFCESV